ncbi:hypothetical protein ACFYTC_06065 [Actinomadura nitritigenes]|uniref:hypothetical protein n=1 Tax=Actinomadura nitritigenes TaxID=134602 RepID=UPI003695FB3A
MLWNAGAVSEVSGSAAPTLSDRLAGPLSEPLRELGSADPAFDASLAAYATFGKLGGYLWSGISPRTATSAGSRRSASACSLR